MKEGDTGTFLIRLRASEVGSFVLTLNTGNNSARHCIIQRALTAFEIFGEQFRDIVTLVNTFKIKPIVGLHPKTKAILFECLLTTPASNQVCCLFNNGFTVIINNYNRAKDRFRILK